MKTSVSRIRVRPTTRPMGKAGWSAAQTDMALILAHTTPPSPIIIKQEPFSLLLMTEFVKCAVNVPASSLLCSGGLCHTGLCLAHLIPCSFLPPQHAQRYGRRNHKGCRIHCFLEDLPNLFELYGPEKKNLCKSQVKYIWQESGIKEIHPKLRELCSQTSVARLGGYFLPVSGASSPQIFV